MAVLPGVLMPAVAQARSWTVTNTGDGAGKCPSATACTVRVAIADAKSGDRVLLGAHVYRLSPSTGELRVSKTLMIVGKSAPKTKVTFASTPSNSRVIAI